jgi:hypothetical protein
MTTSPGRGKPIVLHAFTSVPRLAEVLPPVRLHQVLPSWWQTLPATITAENSPRAAKTQFQTIKHCYALQQLFARGVALPLWQDIDISIERDGAVASEGAGGRIKVGHPHSRAQYAGAFGSHVWHYKVASPWLFVCDRATHFYWMHPEYHQPDPFRFHTMPGVVEYYHQHETDVNILLPRKPGERMEVALRAGEMLCYMVAASDANLVLRVEEVTEAEFNRINYARNVTKEPMAFNRRLQVKPYRKARRASR